MLKTPLANTFINRVLLKTLCLVLLPLCALWAAVDALGQERTAVPSRGHMELPTHWNGAPLRVLALSDVEQRFAHNFPGQIARRTDDRQVLVLRHVQRPTRMLHPAADCYKGLGYRIAHEQLQRDAQQQLWRCFTATRGRQQQRVCERIVDAHGLGFTDTSAWYWAAQMGQSSGPWQALTVAHAL